MPFEAHADVYGRARPPYPPELWARVRETGLVGPGRRALDLGAGTGEATGPLLATGMDVVAVEPGARLAALLTERHPRAQVIVARAEDVELAAGSFDVAVAATSLHWMDLDVVLPKVHRALKADGRFRGARHSLPGAGRRDRPRARRALEREHGRGRCCRSRKAQPLRIVRRRG